MTTDNTIEQHVDAPVRERWGPLATVGFVLMIWLILEASGFVIGIATTVSHLVASGQPTAHPDIKEITNAVMRVIVPAQALVINPLLLYLVYFLAKKANAGPPLEYLGFRRVSLPRWAVWLIPVVAYGFLEDMAIIGLGRRDIFEFQNMMLDTNPLWLVILLGVVVAPVFEEVLIRGFMYRGLIGSKAGVAGTIVLTAFVWALMHHYYGSLGIVFIFMLGLILGYARHRTGSVKTTIYCHMAYNLLAFSDIGKVLDMHS